MLAVTGSFTSQIQEVQIQFSLLGAVVSLILHAYQAGDHILTIRNMSLIRIRL